MNGKQVEITKSSRLVILTLLVVAFGLIFSASKAVCQEVVKKADSLYIYKKNTALNDSLKNRGEYEKVGQYEFAAKLSKYKEVKQFNNYMPYHLWAVYLIKHGIKIREQLDRMTVELNSHDDSVKGDPKPIEKILSNAIKMQESKMHYEEDVAEFISTFIATGIAEKSEQIGAINLVTNEINRSYDRLFTLATYKLNNISNAIVAETNTTLSREAVNLAKVAIIISIAIAILQFFVSVLPLFKKGK